MKTIITYLLCFCLLFSTSMIYAEETIGTPVNQETQDQATALKCLNENICTSEYMTAERTYSVIMLYISALASFIYVSVCFTQASSVTYHSVAVIWLAWETINNLFIQKEFDTSNLANMEMTLGSDAQITSVVESIRSLNIAKQELDGKIQRATFLQWGWTAAGIIAGVESANLLGWGSCLLGENEKQKNDELLFAMLDPESRFHSIDWSNPLLASIQYQELQYFYTGTYNASNPEHFKQQMELQKLSVIDTPKLNTTQKNLLSQTLAKFFISSAIADTSPGNVTDQELDKLGLRRNAEGKYDTLIGQILLQAISGILLGVTSWKLSGATRAMMITAHVLIVYTAKQIFQEARDQLQKREDALRLLLQEKVLKTDTPPAISDDGPPPTGTAPKADQYATPDPILDPPAGCVTGSGTEMKLDADCSCQKNSSCSTSAIPELIPPAGLDVGTLNGDLGSLNDTLSGAMSGKNNGSSSSLSGMGLGAKAAAAAKRLADLDKQLMNKAKKEGKPVKSILAEAVKHKNALIQSVQEKWPTLDPSIKDTINELAQPEKISHVNAKNKNADVAAVTPAAGKKGAPFKLSFGHDLNSVKGSGQEIEATVAKPAIETNPEVIKEASETNYDGLQDDIWSNSEGDIWQHLSWRYKKSALPRLDLE